MFEQQHQNNNRLQGKRILLHYEYQEAQASIKAGHRIQFEHCSSML